MKRRRTRTPSDAGSPSQEKKVVKSPPTTSKSASSTTSIKDGPSKSSDVQHAANLEDVEVEKRSAAGDVASFERGTEEIRKLVAEIQREKLMVSSQLTRKCWEDFLTCCPVFSQFHLKLFGFKIAPCSTLESLLCILCIPTKWSSVCWVASIHGYLWDVQCHLIYF